MKVTAAAKREARKALEAQGIDFSADFHALPSAQVQLILDRAKQDKYKAPADASGSTARYFFYRLARAN